MKRVIKYIADYIEKQSKLTGQKLRITDFGYGYFSHKAETEKILRDKLNHVKSDLQFYSNKKHRYVGVEQEIIALKAQKEVIEWLQRKMKC